MGFRYRRSIKLFPGVKINFGKKSHSWTIGGKAARTTYNPTTKKVTQSYSTPIKGLSWSKQYSAKQKQEETAVQSTTPAQNKGTIAAIFGLISALLSLGWQLLKIGILLFVLYWIIRIFFF